MTVPPAQTIWDNNPAHERLSQAYDLFYEASDNYALAVSAGVTKSGGSISEISQFVGRKAQIMMAAGQMVGQIIYEQAWEDADSMAASVLVVHDQRLAHGFRADHPYLPANTCPPDDAATFVKYLSDKRAELARDAQAGSPAEIFARAVRHVIFNNAVMWINVYDEVMTDRA